MGTLSRVIFDVDTTPPSIPLNLAATVISQTRIDLTWNASTDPAGPNSGIAGYDIIKDASTTIPIGVQTTYSDTGLAAGSSHTYRVRARDLTGNLSAYGNQASATTTSASSVTPSNITPTHYVSAGATSGTGTLANPYSMAQALALAQPGWRVRCAPGTYVGTNTNNNKTGALRISTAGTEANPIIFFAENYAALNTTNRSILQHTGTLAGQGCPVLGVGTGQYWYGFYVNEDQAPSRVDTSAIYCTGHHLGVKYFRINRGSLTWPSAISGNNRAAIWFEAAQYFEFTDNWVENYSGVGSPHGEQVLMVWSTDIAAGPSAISHHGLIENNYFDNCELGPVVKGASGATRPITGNIVIRKNISRCSGFERGGISGGHVQLMDLGASEGRNQVYQNIFVGGSFGVRPFNQAGAGCVDIDVFNNTGIGFVSSIDTSVDGMFADSGSGAITASAGWRMGNNIKADGVTRLFVCAGGTGTDRAFTYRARNLAFGQASNRWGHAANRAALTLAEWQALGYDLNSLAVSPQLVSSTWGNVDLAKLGTTSPARNAGQDTLQLLGGTTTASINMGAFITSDMSDVIGIRPLS